jgi:hypothetical protein
MPPPSLNKVIRDDWPPTAEFPNPPEFIETPEVDIIYSNIWAGSDFRGLHTGSIGPIEDVLVGLARNIEKGCFKSVLSVSVSKHSLVVVVSTKLSHEELEEKGFVTGVQWKEERGDMESTHKGVGKVGSAEGREE